LFEADPFENDGRCLEIANLKLYLLPDLGY
jgi:hypothetical protein